MKKYAFVDRDGTFLHEPKKPDGVDPRETFPLKNMDGFKFMDGAKEGFKNLVGRGYELVMVTNQTYLGTPRHPQEMFDVVMNRIDEELAAVGVVFDYKIICPHGPDDGCNCRKPAIGGLKDFVAKSGEGIDFENSLIFGDRDTDRQFAENLGVRFVKIETNGRFALPDGL